MIIEAAFFKTMQSIVREGLGRTPHEDQVVSLLQQAIGESGRCAPKLKYPLGEADQPPRVDLFVALDCRIGQGRAKWHHYGVREQNWIEVKLFRHTPPDRTRNAGSIARDLLRLCVFVKEENSRDRLNGRYFAAVFKEEPSHHLAYRGEFESHPGRGWLAELLSHGHREPVTIPLGTTPLDKSHMRFLKTIGERLPDLCPRSARITALTRAVEPAPSDGALGAVWRGYLVRIDGFAVQLGTHEIAYDGLDTSIWGEQRAKDQQNLARDAIQSRWLAPATSLSRRRPGNEALS